MQAEDLRDSITPEAVARYAAVNAATGQTSHHHHPEMETIRQVNYKGHDIVIRTSYKIEVDGKPITGHVLVGNDGRVHYHAVPNQTFASAITMVKRLIELFPDDFREQSPVAHAHHS